MAKPSKKPVPRVAPRRKTKPPPPPRLAARLTAKRSRREMAPQRLEKIESAPGNGMGSEASNPQDLVLGRAAGRARLRLKSRKNDKVAKLQKKAPEALKSLHAELKSAPVAVSNVGASLVRGDRLRGLERPNADRRLSGARKKRRPRDGEGNFPGCKALKRHKTGKESRLAVRMGSRPAIDLGRRLFLGVESLSGRPCQHHEEPLPPPVRTGRRIPYSAASATGE